MNQTFLKLQPSLFSVCCPVPCGPSVNVDLDCQSQALTLNWNASGNAEGYIGVISNSNSQMSYNTTEPKLRISSLQCGHDYTVKVMSYHGTCVSQPSMLPVRQSKKDVCIYLKPIYAVLYNTTTPFTNIIVIIVIYLYYELVL